MGNNHQLRPKPVVLCILDGWGVSESDEHNAIALADTPNWDRIIAENPYATLGTSGLDVGLPDGQMGNSEVGHMNIGSGRIVMQNLPRIDKAISDGSLAQNPELHNLVSNLQETGGTCHIMGLVSDGGVHAHIDHIAALANIMSGANIPVVIHVFTDGRDTPPESGAEYVKRLQNKVENAQIATISGRYYAMDRDNRWERVEIAYNTIVSGEGVRKDNTINAITYSYKEGITDEFIKPAVIGDYTGMNDGDGLVMANFRADRARQILHALLDKDFKGFTRSKTVNFAGAVGMVEYSDELNKLLPALFPAEALHNILGQVIADSDLRQLRIAETEKYAHVTFFFNGGQEQEFPGEDRILVPSPKVATYDLQPEMSAVEVTDRLIEAINADKYDFIVVNYANTDMVGHTGIEQAAIKAVEAVDRALGRLEEAVSGKDGVLLITADHGNAEQMVDLATNSPHTAHTTNPVPFAIVGEGRETTLQPGRLCDIAPTILKIMNISQPQEMSGRNLF